MKKVNPLMVGNLLPGNVEGRTDEGTPIMLTDFKGRSIAIFLIGKGFERTHQTIMKNIASKINDFLAFEYSPIVVSSEPVGVLSSYRESEKLPYVLIADENLHIHRVLSGNNTSEVSGTWLADENGKIVAVVPSMSPRQQVIATLAALARITSNEA